MRNGRIEEMSFVSVSQDLPREFHRSIVFDCNGDDLSQILIFVVIIRIFKPHLLQIVWSLHAIACELVRCLNEIFVLLFKNILRWTQKAYQTSSLLLQSQICWRWEPVLRAFLAEMRCSNEVLSLPYPVVREESRCGKHPSFVRQT